MTHTNDTHRQRHTQQTDRQTDRQTHTHTHTHTQTHTTLFPRYGGPGSQRISRTFPLGSYINNWLTHLKSEHRVVVASVDSRGASGRGQNFRYEMYRKLGTVEVWDQMMAGRYVSGSSRTLERFGWWAQLGLGTDLRSLKIKIGDNFLWLVARTLETRGSNPQCRTARIIVGRYCTRAATRPELLSTLR